MKKYTCVICNYVYDESVGISESGIPAGTKFEDLPEDWVCPICGATKDNFHADAIEEEVIVENQDDSIVEKQDGFSNGQLSALFANLSKGCEKQYKFEESTHFQNLSDYYNNKISYDLDGDYGELIKILKSDTEDKIPSAKKLSESLSERGTLRALTWSEKVSLMIQSSLNYKDNNINIIEGGKSVHICEICGFMFIGEEAPDICPVCKVQKNKITKVGRK